MMSELVDAVARTGNLPTEQALLAVGAVLDFFTSRLPSTAVGELAERLGAAPRQR